MPNDKEKRLRVWCGEELEEGTNTRFLNFHIELSEEIYNELRGEKPSKEFSASMIKHMINLIRWEIVKIRRQRTMGTLDYFNRENNYERDLQSGLEGENIRRVDLPDGFEGNIERIDLNAVMRRRDIRDMGYMARMAGSTEDRNEARFANALRDPTGAVSDPMPKVGFWTRVKRFYLKKKLGFKILWK